MDIRKYFSPNSSSKAKEAVKSKPKKPVAILSSDDDDDFVPNTPDAVIKKKPLIKTHKKRKVIDLDSDSDDASRKQKTFTPKKTKRYGKSATAKKQELLSSSDSEQDKPKAKKNKLKAYDDLAKKNSNLKPISIFEAFGNAPIKQSKVERPKEIINVESIDIPSDDDFDKTLQLLDDEELLKNAITIQESPKLDKDCVQSLNMFITSSADKKKTPGKTPAKRKTSESRDLVADGQDKHEKKQYSAMLYQQYLNRSGPAHHGSKDIPKGKPDCLKNICFLITGVLDSLERSEAEELIKNHGGRTVLQVSKKVQYVIKGNDPGPAKLAKAENYNIPIIVEDELLDMIRKKSGLTSSPEKQKENTTPEKAEKSRENGSSEKKRRKSSEKKLPKSSEKSTAKQENTTRENIKTTRKNGSSEEKPGKSEKTVTKQDNTTPENRENPRKNRSSDHKHRKSSEKSTVKQENATPEKVKNTRETRSSEKKRFKLTETTEREKSTAKRKDVARKIILLDETPRPKIVKKETVVLSTSSKATTSSASTTPAKKTFVIRTENLAWVDKYKPTNLNRIIGQQGDASCVKKLFNWLKNWHTNQNGRTKLTRPSPWSKNDNGAFYKAALLSGAPGIGKTTTATLVAKELGLDVVEFNASDTRNKKLIQSEIGQILNTTSITGYFQHASAPSRKHVLIMDEVDGMSGNEDRGGMQELISLIKTANTPIVCICNDRNHQKVRSLANHCFDLRFTKPRMEQIRGALMTICFQEDLTIKPNVLSEIINGTGLDIRQSINNLYMWANKSKDLSVEQVQKDNKTSHRDSLMTQWEVVKKVFSSEDHKNTNIFDRAQWFFHDYSIGPLFVYENYLHVQPDGCRQEDLNKLIKAADAADSLSRGDLIESAIRRSNAWSLLEVQSIFSSVLPGFHMAGKINKQINFPSWLGKNSRKNKFTRLFSELRSHMSMCISGNKQALCLDYAKYLRNGVIKPLIKNNPNCADTSIKFMQNYNLLREDLDSLCEISLWNDQNPFNSIDSKVKAAFTRSYNKHVVVPYAVTSGPVKKRAAAKEADEFASEEIDEASDVEEDDTVENDAMITAKKRGGKTTKPTASTKEKGKRAATGSSKGKKSSKK